MRRSFTGTQDGGGVLLSPLFAPFLEPLAQVNQRALHRDISGYKMNRSAVLPLNDAEPQTSLESKFEHSFPSVTKIVCDNNDAPFNSVPADLARFLNLFKHNSLFFL